MIKEYKDWLFVPIPKDADSIELHDEEGDPYITYHTGMGTEDYDILRDTLPPGSWQIIGKGDQLFEWDWEGVIDGAWFQLANEKGWRDYSFPDLRYPFQTATASAMSLLSSNNLEAKETIILKLKN